jgi:chaperonin GroES
MAEERVKRRLAAILAADVVGYSRLMEQDEAGTLDRVLIRGVAQEEKSAGGIIIPDTAKEKPMEGEVIAVGPGARSEDGRVQPLDVKVGDRVLFCKWTGTEIKVDGKDLLIMKESDIMGVIARDAGSKRKAA